MKKIIAVLLVVWSIPVVAQEDWLTEVQKRVIAKHTFSLTQDPPGARGGVTPTTLSSTYLADSANLARLDAASNVFVGPITASVFTGPLTGNASTATALQTARTINGVSFDGTSNITISGSSTIVGITGTLAEFNTALTGADFASGGGTATGTNTGDQTTITGNAGTATALLNARTIAGVSFNGTANIAIPSTGLSDTANIAYLNASSTTFTGTLGFLINSALTVNAGGNLTGVSITSGLKGAPAVNFANTGGNLGQIFFGDDGSFALVRKKTSDLTYLDFTPSGTGTIAGLVNLNGGIAVDTTNFTVNGTTGAVSAPGGITGALTGNASTATTLQTARNINGVSFNGSANISVPSDIAPSTSGNVLTSNGSVWTSAAPTGGSQTPWTANVNAAGYVLYGNSTSSGSLWLESTSHATKGEVTLNGGTLGFRIGGVEKWLISSTFALRAGNVAAGSDFVHWLPTNNILGLATSSSAQQLGFYNPNGLVGQIYTNGASTGYATTSDIRLKRDLGLATDLSALRALRVHDFDWRSDGSRDRNVFAQEAYAVSTRGVTTGTEDLSKPWMTEKAAYVPDLIVGWQQHDVELTALRSGITLKATDGANCFRITVNNAGTLATTGVPCP